MSAVTGRTTEKVDPVTEAGGLLPHSLSLAFPQSRGSCLTARIPTGIFLLPTVTSLLLYIHITYVLFLSDTYQLLHHSLYYHHFSSSSFGVDTELVGSAH